MKEIKFAIRCTGTTKPVRYKTATPSGSSRSSHSISSRGSRSLTGTPAAARRRGTAATSGTAASATKSARL